MAPSKAPPLPPTFAVLILTHGRPANVITYAMLRNNGYTGRIVLVVDNEDSTAAQYQALYGDQVVIFDKLAIARAHDQGDNSQDRRSVFYARNASFQIARDLGLETFLMLDDDYTGVEYKFTASLSYKYRPCHRLDDLFAIVLDYYLSIPALTVAIAQNGDWIGGGQGAAGSSLWLKRKAMNTFFCHVDRPISFVGRINEDVNTYTSVGARGGLFLTFFNVSIHQIQTQTNDGGMTGLYLDGGTFLKSFFSVMYAPSCVKVSEMGDKHRRIHHRVDWAHAVPVILSEQYRKER